MKKYADTNFITGLRAIAILLVFFTHSGGGGGINPLFNSFVEFGKYGVQVFFVISGFSIFYQFFERNYTFKKFLIIRVIRISLVYLPLICLVYLYFLLTQNTLNPWADILNHGQISFTNFILHVTYLGGFSKYFANSIIGVEWSLNIEIFYYFTFCLLIYLKFIKKNLKNIIINNVIFLFLSFFFIILSKLNYIDNLQNAWMPFIYGYMFMLGGSSFFVRKNINFSQKTQNFISNFNLIFVILLFFLLIYIRSIYQISSSITSFLVCIFTFLLICFTNEFAYFSKILTNKIILFLGNISYSFYLLHFIVINTKISNQISDNYLLQICINFILTIIFSYIFYFTCERYLYNKFKKMF